MSGRGSVRRGGGGVAGSGGVFVRAQKAGVFFTDFVNQFLNLNIDNFTRSNYLDRGYLYCSHHQPGHGVCRSSGDHGVT